MAATETGQTRLAVLAQPKQAPLFVPDRRSVYWVDRYPLQPGPDGTTKFTVNTRQNELSAHRRTQPGWTGIHRPTPIWSVSEAAQNAQASARVSDLASHKLLHRSYEFDRSVYTEVTPAAQSATATQRVTALSQQKPHLMWPSHDMIRDGPFNEPITVVSAPAMGARSSQRVDTLAEHKEPHALFRPEKNVIWPVNKNAMNAVATFRLQQLARPKSARLKKDDFDPYKVGMGARNARATPRVCELSEPIPRKVRQKKQQ